MHEPGKCLHHGVRIRVICTLGRIAERRQIANDRCRSDGGYERLEICAVTIGRDDDCVGAVDDCDERIDITRDIVGKDKDGRSTPVAEGGSEK